MVQEIWQRIRSHRLNESGVAVYTFNLLYFVLCKYNILVLDILERDASALDPSIEV